MDRRNFIKKTCTACLSITAISVIGTSCVATKYMTGNLVKDGLVINKNDFKIKQNGGTAYSSFIILRNDALKFPVCVYRFSDHEFTALWMQCTHQGAELQAAGDTLQCPAHGSEFDNKGFLKNGPADSNLRTFPVTVNNNEIFIDMRKQS